VVKINRLGDNVSQILFVCWETSVFADGWDFSVVQVLVQVVVEVVSLSLGGGETVDVWGVDITTVDNWGIDNVVVDGLTSLTGVGWDVTGDGLVDLWGKVFLLDEALEELLTDELTLNNGINNWELLTLNWELLGNLLYWNDLLVNLDINDLGLFNNLTFTGDWLNDDLLGGGENLDVSLDFSDISNDWLGDQQVPVKLLQKEFVVDTLGGGWVLVLASEGWESIAARDHILLSVSIWEDILVLVVEVIIRLTSEDVLLTIDLILSINLILSIDGLVLVWGGVFIFEELDKWVNVLVEVDGVQEVLTEGGDLPELLEVDGSNVPLEDWVLDVLSEEGDGQVLTEEFSVVDLFEGEDTINIIDSAEKLLLSIDKELLLLYWQDTVNDISNNGLLYREALAQLLLQQEFIDNWTLEQGPFLGQTEGVQIEAASSYGGDESDKDEGFHDEFAN